MKKPRTIQTKRSRPKARFFKLNATTRAPKKRTQRATTTAARTDLGEVPEVGVSRALVVILLLHVAALAGIFLHNKWSNSADIQASIPALEETKPPARISSLKPYTVSAGDTYESIASKFGLKQDSLEKVNEGKELEAGWIINLPNPPRVVSYPTPRVAETDQAPPRPERSFTHQSRPVIQTSNSELRPGSLPGEGVVLGEAIEPSTEKAILIKPRRPMVQTPKTAPPEPRPSTQAAPVEAPTRQHVVRSGDTLWAIANKNGISVDRLKRANPGVNAQSLRIGVSLVIPQRR